MFDNPKNITLVFLLFVLVNAYPLYLLILLLLNAQLFRRSRLLAIIFPIVFLIVFFIAVFDFVDGFSRGETQTENFGIDIRADSSKIDTPVPIGGTYSFGNNPETERVGSLLVYPISDSAALFYIDVTWGPPSYNMGGLFGQMTISGNEGVYNSGEHVDDLNCVIRFKFSADEIRVITEAGSEECGFGGNVFVDNTYRLYDREIPTYFISGDGEPVLFGGTAKEKYLGRIGDFAR